MHQPAQYNKNKAAEKNIMENILSTLIKNHKLSDTDQVICSYISQNLDEIPHLSSRELARNSHTSSSAVLRLSKKLGFQNYNDFRLHIVSYMKEVDLGEFNISGMEDSLTLIDALTEVEISTIRATSETMPTKKMIEAVDLMNRAKYIDILANDANSDIARYACHNFFMTGKFSHVYNSLDNQAYMTMEADKDHVVIVLTKYGATPSILECLKVLYKRGIPVIGFLTEEGKSLEKLCDISFHCHESDSFERLGHLTYNISTKYLFDLMFALLFARNYQATLQRVRKRREMYHPRDH